ncbi:MAG: hypothetical protein NTW49_06040 [Bacteroidia bacterium]|nr:hypothetical protein [Bacteroidia bacterium]
MSDYRGDTPYTNFKEHKTKYAKGYRGQSQKTIGERPGKGNARAKKHSEDHQDKMGHDNGNDAGHDDNMKKDHGHDDGRNKKK